MMKKIIILSISSLLWLSPLRGSLEGAFAQTITSPDGNIKVSLSVNSEGTPYYNITYGNTVVIQNSPLGLATSVGDFTKGLSLKSAGESKQVEGSYDLTNGKNCRGEKRSNIIQPFLVSFWKRASFHFAYRPSRPGKTKMFYASLIPFDFTGCSWNPCAD